MSCIEGADIVAKIPKVIHQIWLHGELPDIYQEFRDRWMRLHPEWSFRMWSEDELVPLMNRPEYDAFGEAMFKADIARYEILVQFGGVYIDVDVVPFRPIDPLVRGTDHFLIAEQMTIITNCVMGASPNHPLLWAVIRELPHNVRALPHHHGLLRVGPHYLTRVVEERFRDALVLPPEVFCPVSYGELDRASPRFHPAAYGAHVWNSVCGSDEVARWLSANRETPNGAVVT